MRYSAVLALAMYCAVLCPPANAQAPDADKFKAFLASELHKGLINRALGALPPIVFQRCPSLVSTNSSVIILRPVAYGSDGVPNAGVWREAFPVSGCGNDTQINLYFAAGSDGKINTTVGIPGATRADLVLQRDGMNYAFIGAAAAAKDCKQFIVKNTRFEAFGSRNPPTPDPGPNARFRPWWETWTLVGCGRTFDVPISFTPDQTGTQIVQASREVVERR